MIKRRLIRILTPYSKTFYFVDRGVQRGLVYEIGEILERDLNKRLNTGNVKVHVAIIPMPQSEFIPALRWGRGDIAMGNLTVTSERAKRVDFSDPAMKDVAEIVVTGARGSADRGRRGSGGRGLFTFAAYNAGPGRIDGLRRVTAQGGLDPNVWFNNVELVAAEKIGA